MDARVGARVEHGKQVVGPVQEPAEFADGGRQQLQDGRPARQGLAKIQFFSEVCLSRKGEASITNYDTSNCFQE